MKTLFALLIMATGLLGLVFPRLSWYLAAGWKFQDAEPSDLALVVYRVSGAVAVVLGLWVLLSS